MYFALLQSAGDGRLAAPGAAGYSYGHYVPHNETPSFDNLNTEHAALQ